MRASNIREIIDCFVRKESPYQCILIDGKWGIGKTYEMENGAAGCCATNQIYCNRKIAMIKRIMGLLLLTGVLLLAACGAGAGTAAGSASESAAGSAPAPHSAKTVEPLPAALHADALDDCTFAAGFQASDVALNDDGMMVVHLTVYDYELFDLVDISQLAAGDSKR